MFTQIRPLFKPPQSSGRFLLTYDKGADTASIIDFAKGLNLTPFVLTANQGAANALSLAGINAMAGNLGRDVEGSHRQFSLVIVPGHVLEKDFNLDDVQSFNMDWQMVLSSGPYLQSNGVLCYSLSLERMKRRSQHVFTQLSMHYQQLELYKLDPQTVVIVGKRRAQTDGKSDVNSIRYLINALSSGNRQNDPLKGDYFLPVEPPRAWFRSKRFDPIAMTPMIASRINSEMSVLRREWFGWKVPTIEPIGILPAVLYAYITASGYLPQRRLISPKNGHTCVILGLIKRKKSTFEKDMENNRGDIVGKTKIQEDSFKNMITVLDLDDKTIDTIDVNSPREMASFIDVWQDVMGEIVQNEYPPIYDCVKAPYIQPDGNPGIFKQWAAQVIDRPLNKFFYQSFDKRLPQLTIPQRHTVAGNTLALLGQDILQTIPTRRLTARKAVLLDASTGTGKTLMTSLMLEILCRNYASKKNLKISGSAGRWPVCMFVTTRTNLDNVCKEVHAASPLLQTMKVTNVKEMKEALQQAHYLPAPVVLVTPRSMLSQTQYIKPAVVLGDFQYPEGLEPTDDDNSFSIVAHCPHCWERVALKPVKFRVEDGEAEEEIAKRKKYLIQNGLEEIVSQEGLSAGLRGKKCENCRRPLYSEVRGNHYTLSNRLKRELKRQKQNFPLGIAYDEIHQDKAENSKCGYQMGVLTGFFQKVIAATASPFNGKASSIFFLNYRLFNSFREVWKPGEKEEFIKLYGVTRKVWNDEKNTWNKASELPSLSPELAVIMLNHFSYLNEESAGFKKPPRIDIPIIISPSEEERKAYNYYVQTLNANLQTQGNSMSKHLGRVDPQAAMLLRLYPTGVHHPDLWEFSPAWSCPICHKHKYSGEPCLHKWVKENPKTKDNEVVPILDENYVSSKERKLMELVQEENKQRRVPLILCYFTGKYQTDQRLEDVFRRNGIKTLNVKTVQSEKIEAAVNNAGLEGYNAVIGNIRRLANGVNLIGTPTIIFHEVDYPPEINYQASGRAHRPTQTQPCKNIYLTVEGMAENVVLARTVEGMANIALSSGTLPDMPDLLEAIGHSQDFTEMIVKGVSSKLKNDITSAFAKLNSIWEERYGSQIIVTPVKELEDKELAKREPILGAQMSFFVEAHKEIMPALTKEALKGAKQISFFEL